MAGAFLLLGLFAQAASSLVRRGSSAARTSFD
jgi:hypothetical protein